MLRIGGVFLIKEIKIGEGEEVELIFKTEDGKRTLSLKGGFSLEEGRELSSYVSVPFGSRPLQFFIEGSEKVSIDLRLLPQYLPTKGELSISAIELKWEEGKIFDRCLKCGCKYFKNEGPHPIEGGRIYKCKRCSHQFVFTKEIINQSKLPLDEKIREF